MLIIRYAPNVTALCLGLFLVIMGLWSCIKGISALYRNLPPSGERLRDLPGGEILIGILCLSLGLWCSVKEIPRLLLPSHERPILLQLDEKGFTRAPSLSPLFFTWSEACFRLPDIHFSGIPLSGHQFIAWAEVREIRFCKKRKRPWKCQFLLKDQTRSFEISLFDLDIKRQDFIAALKKYFKGPITGDLFF